MSFQSSKPNWRELNIGLGLCLLTAVAYAQVCNFGFVRYDDYCYVADNPDVLDGFSLASIGWAFSSGDCDNWHPLTWLSLMLDCEICLGSDGAIDRTALANCMHVVNLLIHIANTVLLFALLRQLTDRIWPSAAVAALFALHPLHVESVAWISERKDVLSTLFGFLAIAAYGRYGKQSGGWELAGVAVFQALSLLAKPMFVTLPVLLLLLDFWPLGRWSVDQPHRLRVFASLVWEKAMLFVLSAASSAVTIYVQAQGGALKSVEMFPLPVRFANTAVSYIEYIQKTIWPADLAIYYAHPIYEPRAWFTDGAFYGWAVVDAFVLLALTLAVIYFARRMPYLAVGWLWYLVSLLPVIGIVQVGGQALADRYAYVPSVGLFITTAWGVADATRRLPLRQVWLALCSAAVVAACAVTTWRQSSHWRDSRSLFERAIAVTANNAWAHQLLARALFLDGNTSEAIDHFREAIRQAPHDYDAHRELGIAYACNGHDTAAIKCFQVAIERKPDHLAAHENLGDAFARRGDLASAIEEYVAVLRRQPDSPVVVAKLKILLPGNSSTDKAVASWAANVPKANAEASERARAHFTVTTADPARFDDVQKLVNEAQRLQRSKTIDPGKRLYEAKPGDL
jgi:tetratricopeptide (TPR) repeat protein